LGNPQQPQWWCAREYVPGKATEAQRGKEKYVLKILRDQDVLERRQRMHREVKAQQQLDHPRLPKIKECNTEACGDLAVPLFFVMDHIDGRTLEERVMEAPLHPDEAIRLVIDLSAVLIYCHERGIIHRDIKPNNIILRGGNPADPFLIDFGLSFNQLDSEQSSLTPDWQQLGNRFLHLPELQTADSSKRYVESDISQLCGVLFYALTGQVPAHLKDHEGRKPHERVSAKAILDKIDSPALIYLFDKGFERDLSKRFGSAEAIRGRFCEVRDEFKYTLAQFSQSATTVTLERMAPGSESSLPRPAGGGSNSAEEIKKEEEETIRTLQEGFSRDQVDALAYASLLGSWNEKSDGDVDTIRKLIEGGN